MARAAIEESHARRRLRATPISALKAGCDRSFDAARVKLRSFGEPGKRATGAGRRRHPIFRSIDPYVRFYRLKQHIPTVDSRPAAAGHETETNEHRNDPARRRRRGILRRSHRRRRGRWWRTLHAGRGGPAAIQSSRSWPSARSPWPSSTPARPIEVRLRAAAGAGGGAADPGAMRSSTRVAVASATSAPPIRAARRVFINDTRSTSSGLPDTAHRRGRGRRPSRNDPERREATSCASSCPPNTRSRPVRRAPTSTRAQREIAAGVEARARRWW